jgi:hypothetical protein
MRPRNCLWQFRGLVLKLPLAQGIEAEILLAQPKDWSGKPGFWRFAPKMRPDYKLQMRF